MRFVPSVPSVPTPTSGHARSPWRRVAGLSLPELLIGLAAGAIVVAGALAMLAAPLRAATSADREARAAQDLDAVQRLLARLVRQAVPAPDGTAAMAVTDGGTTLAFHTVDDAGVVRPVSWRLADGQLSLRLDAGGWQAVTDARTLAVREGRFDVVGWPAAGCAVTVPAVRWSLLVRPAAEAAAPWRRIDGMAQVRHPWRPDAGCRP